VNAYLTKVMIFTCAAVAVMLWLVSKLLPEWGFELTFGTWLLFTAPAVAIEVLGTAFVHRRGAH